MTHFFFALIRVCLCTANLEEFDLAHLYLFSQKLILFTIELRKNISTINFSKALKTSVFTYKARGSTTCTIAFIVIIHSPQDYIEIISFVGLTLQFIVNFLFFPQLTKIYLICFTLKPVFAADYNLYYIFNLLIYVIVL